MKSILRITRKNWDEHSKYDWEEIRYLLYPNGSYKISAKNGLKNLIFELSSKGILSIEKLTEAKALISQFNNHKPFPKIDAFDGEAFEISTYDKQGNIVGHRSLGYIYGIEVIEKLIKIFD